MGNIQTSEGGKSATKLGQKGGGRSKMRLLGGKKNTKQGEWTCVGPEESEPKKSNEICFHAVIGADEACKSTSSSNSNFTLALSPAGLGQESSFVNDKLDIIPNQSSIANTSPLSLKPLSYSTSMNNDGDNSFIEVFQPLNVFKLNEFRARVDQEKALKLTKLGVTTTSQISLEGDGNGFSTGVLEISEDGSDCRLNREKLELVTNKDEQNDLFYHACPPTYRRHMSVPLDVAAISEELSLQKAPSLSKAELEARLQRPTFVPEKLDFKLYEKFEGYMLVNWYLSELGLDSPARMQLGVAELKLLAAQFCTHLLAAGVLKQLPDPGVPPTNVFRPDCIYFWSHAEAPQSQPQTPGKLSTIFWPPTSPSDISPNDVQDNSECQMVSLQYQEKKSSAKDVEILSLEEEIRSLKQEVETYKTLIDIQNLTALAVNDFPSPSETNRGNFNNANGPNIEILPMNDQTFTNIEMKLKHIEVQTDLEKMVIEVETQTDEVLSSATTKTPSLPQDALTNAIQFSSPPPCPPPPPPPPLLPLLTSTAPALSQSLPDESNPALSTSFCPKLAPPPPPPPCPAFPAGLPCLGIPVPPIPCPGLPPPPPMPGGSFKTSPSSPGCPLPMPAPPPGGFNPQKAGNEFAPSYLAMKKAAINPPVPMKPLFWTRILVAQAAKLDDGPPLWEEIEELPLNVVPEDFTKLFSRQVVNRIQIVRKQEQKPKVEVVKLLDGKRSQSVGILAQSLRQDFIEIENAIYTFDTSVVSLEALQQIYEVRATREELSLITEHLATRPDVPLDKPEQFLYDLSQIANFAERITCLTFQVEFEDAVTTISHTLGNFSSTCEFLMKSAELKQVLSLILTLGNYMNGGNVARGQADGFGLEVLSRLKDVKGAQAGVTLLHFVVSTYTRNFLDGDKSPPLPVPEPGDVRRAMALDFDVLRGELCRLSNKLSECEKRTKEVIANSNPENLQPFKDKMEAFLEKSRTQYETECENLEECHKMFIAMMKRYLFKPKGGVLEAFAPSGFFELWLPFCIDFKDIYKKEILKIQVERAQEIKRKEYYEANVIKERENGLKAKFKKARARLDKQGQDGDNETL